MPGPSEPVVVVGHDLAALAAAARLAKSGHRVTLVAGSGRLGGRWSPASVSPEGLERSGDAGSSGSRPERTDDLSPTVLAFPAPWRDLFRKSGRPLEEELRRVGLALVPAPPTRHHFPDGSVLDLPTGRAEQQQAVTRFAGTTAAAAWRDLLDGLAAVWQTLRFRGVETPLTGPSALDRATRRALWADRTVAELAAGLPDGRLGALVADLAPLNGSTPDATPAFVAVDLFVDQTFGRWLVHATEASEAAGPVPLSALVGLLTARLDLRGVRVLTDATVERVETGPGRGAGVRSVRLADGTGLDAAAVVATGDLAGFYDRRLAGIRAPGLAAERRRLRRTAPALAPRLSSATEPGQPSDPPELVVHRDGRPPLVRHRHPGGVVVRAEHDGARPDPTAGVRWQGFAGWCDRPPTTAAVPGLHLAGPSTRSGSGPDRQLLSATLAAVAVGARFGDVK